MPKIDELDKNLKVSTSISKEDILFFDVRQEPFSVHGLLYENGQFRRVPKTVADSVSKGVSYLSQNCAGGRVRFQTDSSYVAIAAKMTQVDKMPHFALTGSSGFDMYVDEGSGIRYYGTFVPPMDMTDGYASVLEFQDRKMREITIHFPLYSGVDELHVGLQEDAVVQAAVPYRNKKPYVYYGHSITQGGCATRPGNAYPSILSRRFHIDHINLGFSGNGKGEPEITEYIAGLDMECFVMDYDANAPDPEHLRNTHEKMFRAIRKAHPKIPVIFMSTTVMPRFQKYLRDERRDIVYQTYQNAKAAGDSNVYFWDGGKEFAPYEEYGTVEGCHPIDYGFCGIAKSLGDLIEQIMG